MAGDISIHNVPTHSNLPARTNWEQKQQRRKTAEPASEEDADSSTHEPSAGDNAEAPSEPTKGTGHIGTQIDVEA